MDNPFDLLGLPHRFDLTPDAVERAYLARVAAVHPDGGGGDDQASARLNDAAAALRDPEARAAHLLSLLGGPDKSVDRSLPHGFLVEIMEAREEIEEAMSSGEQARIESARAWAATRRSAYIASVGELFRSLPAVGRDAALAAIRRELNAWRYIERLVEQLDPAYDPNRADFKGH